MRCWQRIKPAIDYMLYPCGNSVLYYHCQQCEYKKLYYNAEYGHHVVWYIYSFLFFISLSYAPFINWPDRNMVTIFFYVIILIVGQ